MKDWKARVYLILLLLLGGTFAGCDLNQPPDDFVSPDQLYSSAENARAGLNGAYFGLGDFLLQFSGVPRLAYGPTEMVLTLRSTTSNVGIMNNYLVTPTLGDPPRLAWEPGYQSINQVNQVINRTSGLEDSDQKARILSEARFLRALQYFYLVRFFGSVPLVKSETQGITGLKKPRTPEDSVYAFIIEELEGAVETLPPQSAISDFGRASRGAAKTLLANVYLQRASLSAANGLTGERQIAQPGDYQQAADLAQEVIDSGEYNLLPNYADIFDAENEQNEEIIFSIQITVGSGPGNILPCEAALINSGASNTAWGKYSVELPFYNSYEDMDTRKEATYITEYTREDNGEKVTWDRNNIEGDGYSFQTPGFSKYSIASPASGGCGDDNDFIIFRHAGLLLMKAEALNEANGGPTAAAYEAINKVRARAGKPPLSAGLSYEAFREAVYQEWRWEFAFEGNGWFVGQRFFDIFERRVEEYAKIGREITPQFWVPDVDVEDPKHRLYPIPQSAIDRNPELTQNPGY